MRDWQIPTDKCREVLTGLEGLQGLQRRGVAFGLPELGPGIWRVEVELANF